MGRADTNWLDATRKDLCFKRRIKSMCAIPDTKYHSRVSTILL